MSQTLPDSPAGDCPSLELLSDYCSGRVSEDDGQRLMAHLETCVRCADLIANTDFSADNLEQSLRQAAHAPWPAAEPELLEMELLIREALSETSTAQAGGSAVGGQGKAAGRARPRVLPAHRPGHQIGQYQLLGQLGQGGMGVVYLARHASLKRHVALKVLAENRIGDQRSLRRFHREMEAIGKLGSPHIVQAFDAGQADGVHYLAMEYVAGPDVHSVSRSVGRLQTADACEIIRQAAIGLQHIHDLGLVHRDIKPSNLLIEPEGKVKLADFGLTSLHGGTEEESALTSRECIVGTPDFMSPEQGDSEGDVDGRSDLYSLGCTLYTLLAGAPPFAGIPYETSLKKVVAHASVPPPEISTFRTDVPTEVVALLRQLLAKKPDDRFASAAALAESLQPWTAEADLPALVGEVPYRQLSPLETDSRLGDTAPVALPGGPFSLSGGGLRWLGGGIAVLVLGFLFAQAMPWTGELYKPRSLSSRYNERLLEEGKEGVPPVGLLEFPAEGGVVPAATGSEPPAAIPQPDLFENMLPEDVEPNKWYPLMNVSPLLRHWHDEPLAGFTHSAEKQMISAHRTGLGMLELGNAPVSDYTLQIDLHQHVWTGLVGIYFGLHPDFDGQNIYRYQRLMLQSSGEEGRPLRRFVMLRGTVRWKADPNAPPPAMVEQNLGYNDVPAPESASQMLELVVKNGHVESIRWNGTRLEKLATTDINKRLGPDDAVGGFGVYLFNSEGQYLNGRIAFNKRYVWQPGVNLDGDENGDKDGDKNEGANQESP